MKWEVRLARSAEREFRGLPGDVAQRVTRALYRLQDNPRPRGARKLIHGPGWRLRVGEYRVLYVIEELPRVVTVFAIGHRRDIYRR
jgi:mRNA interferase RelE/StbE